MIGFFAILIGKFSDSNRPSGLPAVSATVEPTPSTPTARSIDSGSVGSRDASLSEPLTQYQIGQEFSVGYFTYRVNRVETKSRPNHGPVLAVDVTIRNNDDTGSVTPQLRLLDQDGKDYGGTVLELGNAFR